MLEEATAEGEPPPKEYSPAVREAAHYGMFCNHTARALLHDWLAHVSGKKVGQREWKLLADCIESALLGARTWTPEAETALVAQPEEQRSSKPQVEGSSPSERATEPVE